MTNPPPAPRVTAGRAASPAPPAARTPARRREGGTSRENSGTLLKQRQAASPGTTRDETPPQFSRTPFLCQTPPAPSLSLSRARPAAPPPRLSPPLRGRGGTAHPRSPPRTRGAAGRGFTCEGAGSLQGGGGVQLLGVLAVLIGSVNQPLGRRQGGVSADGGA